MQKHNAPKTFFEKLPKEKRRFFQSLASVTENGWTMNIWTHLAVK